MQKGESEEGEKEQYATSTAINMKPTRFSFPWLHGPRPQLPAIAHTTLISSGPNGPHPHLTGYSTARSASSQRLRQKARASSAARPKPKTRCSTVRMHYVYILRREAPRAAWLLWNLFIVPSSLRTSEPCHVQKGEPPPAHLLRYEWVNQGLFRTDPQRAVRFPVHISIPCVPLPTRL